MSHPPSINIVTPRLSNFGQQVGSSIIQTSQHAKTIGVESYSPACVGCVGGGGLVDVDWEVLLAIFVVVDLIEAEGQHEAADAPADDH